MLKQKVFEHHEHPYHFLSSLKYLSHTHEKKQPKNKLAGTQSCDDFQKKINLERGVPGFPWD